MFYIYIYIFFFDYQSNSENICAKLHEEILKSSQDRETYPKWPTKNLKIVPGDKHTTKKQKNTQKCSTVEMDMLSNFLVQ